MKRTVLFSVLLAVNCASGDLMSGSASAANGVGFSYVTRLEPPAPPLTHFGGGTVGDKAVIKRFLCDERQNTYFGYDISIEPLGDGRFRYTFAPLTITPAKMQSIYRKQVTWKPLPLPQQPATQILRQGQTVALDLFVNGVTGQRLVDYITAQGRSRVQAPPGPARDFSVEEATLELSEPQLTANGNVIGSSVRFSLTGSPVWVYIPERGRFIFSLQPHPELGFRKAGEVRGNTLTWGWGGDEFSLSTDKRIAPGEGAYNLYVFNDPSFHIRTSDPFTLGAGGKLESYVRR
jgi:hypothetical protein